MWRIANNAVYFRVCLFLHVIHPLRVITKLKLQGLEFFVGLKNTGKVKSMVEATKKGWRTLLCWWFISLWCTLLSRGLLCGSNTSNTIDTIL